MDASSQPATPSARPRGPRWGCLLATMAALCALGVAVVLGLGCCAWNRVMRLGAASDLARIRNEVLECELSGPDKERLVSEIQDLRELVRTGPRRVSFFAWVDLEDSIRALTRDRHLPPEEIALLERELEALRRELVPRTSD